MDDDDEEEEADDDLEVINIGGAKKGVYVRSIYIGSWGSIALGLVTSSLCILACFDSGC